MHRVLWIILRSPAPLLADLNLIDLPKYTADNRSPIRAWSAIAKQQSIRGQKNSSAVLLEKHLRIWHGERRVAKRMTLLDLSPQLSVVLSRIAGNV